MNEEGNNDERRAREIIATFLAAGGVRTQEDWTALIAAHPEFAGEIADAALLERAVVTLDESDIEFHLDKEAFDSSVSKAISLLYEIPSDSLREAQERIAAVQGPGVRALAQDVGLGSASSLLSGILVGAIEAPRKLLDELADKFDSSAMVLGECFRRARESATVPAFKAESGKPGLGTKPLAWEDAVRSLNLPEAETQRLLQLRD